MTKAFFQRLGALVLLLWLGAAIAAWLLLGPSDNLVAARPTRTGTLPDYRLAPEDLSTEAAVLQKNLIWGMERDCKPPKTAAEKAKEEEKKKPLPWYLLAAVKKSGTRYIVISINKQPPTVVQEGEALPDGSRLLEVGEKTLLIEKPEGEKHQIYLSF